MSYEGPVVDRLLSVADRMADPAAYRAAMERLRANPDEPTFDEFEDAASGRVFQGFTAPVLDDRGGFLGRIWTLREVTEQRELDRLKDDFVATVSHELRTPLTSMMGFLEMIREGEAGELNDEQQRFLAIVYRSSERLQRLVGDLLFVARLDANGLQLQFADVDVTEVVRDAVESTAALARSRAIDLRAELADVPSVIGDRERLSQLVGNLISNALKFTPEGGTVTARTFVDGDSAVIEVADTGIGIPEAEQSRLFQRFFRSSTATEQAIPGTGLGLVISRAIAEAHGGSISVRLGARRGDVVPRRASVRRGGGRGLTRIVALDVGSSSVRAVAYDADGSAEPGAAHLTYDDLDADRLVDACRAVLAQVGDGDVLAISCFWHSLVAVDERDRPLTPVLTWRDLAGGEPPAARRGGLPPAHRLLPPSGVLAREDQASREPKGCGRPAICRSATCCSDGWPARCVRASRSRAAPGCSIPRAATGTARRSTRSDCRRSGSPRSRTSRLPASFPRSATARARTSAPAARRANARR